MRKKLMLKRKTKRERGEEIDDEKEREKLMTRKREIKKRYK